MDLEEDDRIEKLASKVDSLKRALNRENTCYHKFFDSVLEPKITKQISELKQKNVNLTKSNRQLEKDVGFCKQF